ncbi:MAG: histidine phosphatase family protein [Oscillospiraceae bacterium]
MKIYLVRHGHTQWNEHKIIQGRTDTDLSQKGIEQAVTLASSLQSQNLNIVNLYTSRQLRAAKTAQIIADALNVPLTTQAGLEEISFGLWEGLTWGQVQAQYPNEFEVWSANRRYQPTLQGESYQQLLERVVPALKQIINSNKGDVLAVTHSAVIMCLNCLLHSIPFAEMGKHKIPNAQLVPYNDEQINLIHARL